MDARELCPILLAPAAMSGSKPAPFIRAFTSPLTQEAALSKNKNILTFYKSAHYPHIEENNHFSEILNEFIKHS
ncbi:TPA: hypothetical protein ACF2PP_001058 [Legionella pneumophila]